MKTIHLRKLNAIMEVKSRTLFSKNLIIMPAFSLVFTWLLKMIYTNMYPDLDFGSYALSIGLLMNTSMTGIYCVAASLAEEKEKHTLRTLMTSSVNGLEFFIGSLLPALLLLMIVNVLCVFLAGVSFTPGGWIGFLFVTAVSSLISCITGMIFGIFAPNQMTAGTLTTPLLLVLMFPDERYPGYDLWISVHRSTLRSTWESEQGTASYNDEGNSCSHPGSVDLSTAFSDSVPKKRL